MSDRSGLFSSTLLSERSFSAEEMAFLAIGAAMEKKAYRPVILDLRNQGAFTEYFAIVSANNGRQAAAIADEVRVFFKKAFGILPLATEGLETQTWVLLDYGAFFVHIFQDATRELYRLEQLWSKGLLVNVTEERVRELAREVTPLATAEVVEA